MIKLLYVLMVAGITAAVMFGVYHYRHAKRTMDIIAEMLDAAMNGTFTEHRFDESRLSALETKFAHYLSASEISAQNVAVEKDKIKTLISDISHQVKTPIANLLLYSELLEEQRLPETEHNYAEALHEQAEKLRILTDSLVKMSRLETGILTLQPHPGKLEPMLQKVREQLLPKAEAKGLFLQLERTECSAVYDAKWTNEALCNLVDNAVKYTEQGGVTISAKEYEMFVCIEVSDTGIGIAEEEQSAIFARFYRSPEVSDAEGVGIGLYLVRKIIAGQGGYIRVSSEAGKGSTFKLFLPRQQ